MQIVGLMLVRNEADILRVNLRHHLSSGIDRFLVVDNGSSDGTGQILQEFAREGRVRWTRDAGRYRQAEITTELAREASREGADWVIPIDADEFWRAMDGDLRSVLERTADSALRVQVINFVQRRDQIEATPDALIHMTRRTALPMGPLERVRERVESEEFAYVEMMYQPKWISRAGPDIEIAMGNHAVKGIEGAQSDTDEILCLHALLRARSVLEAKVEQGARVQQLGLNPEQGWHVRRWHRLARNGGLENEWRANSYEEDHLDVFGKPHRLVFDPALRDVVLPWIEKPALKRTSIAPLHERKKSPAPSEKAARREVLRRGEYRDLQRTIQEQLIAHREQIDQIVRTFDADLKRRDQAIYESQADLRARIIERDDLIRGLQSELHAKTGERDRIILGLQHELREKVAAGDQLILSLQNELQSKTAERDGIILRLQDELKDRILERNQALEELKDRSRGQSTPGPVSMDTKALEGIASKLETILETLSRTEADERLRQAWVEIERLREESRLRAERESEREARLVRRLQSAQQELQKQASLEKRLARTEQVVREREQAVAPIERDLRDKSDRLLQLEFDHLKTATDLVSIHRSRLWRFGCAYWSVRARVLRILGVIRSPGQPPAVAAAGPSEQQKASTRVSDSTKEDFAEGIPSPMTMSEPVAETQSGPSAELMVISSPIDADSVPGSSGLGPVPWFGHQYDVVCFPIIDWSFRFQRPQQLMCQFAAADHRVFYIAPWFRTAGPPYEVRQLRERVFEVSLRGPELNIYTQTPDEDSVWQIFEHLDQLRRDWSLGATISFVQLPFWYPITTMAKVRLAWPIVYDCMDHHAGFTTNRQEMIAQEVRLRHGADLVVASSFYLEQEAKKDNDKVLLIRNACDFEHFAGTAPEQAGPPVVGYYGAIADWFDSDLVADLAERRPDWRFVLVGSTFTAEIDRLSKLPNVELVGEVPYGEVPKWLARFDVTILPFKRIPLTEATNPVKAYETLAAGKPLVSVPLPEMLLLSPLIRLASTPEEFEREILEELKSKNWAMDRDRRAFAADNTWTARYEKLAPALRDAFPKISIIVVTFNNLEMNRQCLESIYARTSWPNFEVIVVDNASTDGTPEFLQVAEKTYPRLSVILNDSNAGFAAANNQALANASGEYLVFLNNDTIASRGWIEALVRHLKANPEIGLIGPVTNAIGNEAMVAVGYSDVDEMPTWAQDYVRQHAGEVFDIPMLAMFCVAMRREVFEKVGPLDEIFGLGMFEDDDYAIRIRQAGYRVVCARDSFVHHWMKAAFGRIPAPEYEALFLRNRSLFEKKWNIKWVPHSSLPSFAPSSETAPELVEFGLEALGRGHEEAALLGGHVSEK